MKKIFTLITMAVMAISANAQEVTEELIEAGKIFEAAEITMGDITWKNANNKTGINDKERGIKDFYYVAGTGNVYEEIYAEEIYDEETPTNTFRACYKYTHYEDGETGLPKYGLYYKFTPKVDGTLKCQIFVNKGNRKIVVVPASTGKPLTYGTDYQFEGYINGQDVDSDDPDWGPKRYTFFDAAAMLELHTSGNPFILHTGGQNLWGWIVLDVKAGESYYLFQMSSPLSFGGYDFTPAAGEKESYAAAYAEGETIVLSEEFAAVIDENGVAQNVEAGNSVVKFGTENMEAEAVGSGTPTDVVPGKKITSGETGISEITTANDANAPVYNLAGQRVSNDAKGLLIKDGKKFINK